MSDLDFTSRVFRIRRLPQHISSHQEAAQLLSVALRIPVNHVVICSLARTPDRWERLPSRVATLQLQSVPEVMRLNLRKREWEIPVTETSRDRLIIDSHFEGLTVLNDVDPAKHHTDCIAISGLASHAFGSWQPHGPDKSYMWIRDEIPRAMPGVRTFVYGYDSTLVGSRSFQSISDIALSLIHQLKSGGWNLPSSKQIVFLAHSLGGLVLKEALVQVADREKSVASILDNVQGAIMFGVPSLGMQQAHLMSMVEGQANDMLIQDLSRENGSNYLRHLNKLFEGISFTRRARFFWAYETEESPTVVRRPDGSWDKNGPPTVLVNPDSATSHYNYSRRKRTATIPINEDHSNMVKFSRGATCLGPVLSSLMELCFSQPDLISKPQPHKLDGISQSGGNSQHSSGSSFHGYAACEDDLQVDNSIMKELGQLLASLDDIYNYLYSPELDFRIDQIEDPFQDTFRWIFDLPVFRNWLQDSSELFWVHGKPGSGKSTLIKYIFRNNQTWQLLHDWRRSSHEIVASFFFHYRGTALQKSFEGVLRSLILQIMMPHWTTFRKQHQPTWDGFRQLEHHKQKLQSRLSTTQLSLIDAKEKLRQLQEKKDTPQNISPLEFERLSREEIQKLQSRIVELEQRSILLEANIDEVINQLRPFPQQYLPHQTARETRFLADFAKLFNEEGDGPIFKLEKMLRRLLDQDTMPMRLVVFFDALDEFDGHHDMISRFLLGLIKVTSTSSTRVKVCFSSRPTESLQAHFSVYPNIALQDFTRGDIEQYTASSLAASPSIKLLMPIILGRANGVFLWVTLTVRELLNAESGSTKPIPREHLEQKLRELPDDLHQFYELIIARISPLNRRRAFVLLDLLIRQRDPLATADDIRRAVLTSGCSSFQEARDELDLDQSSLKHVDQWRVAERVRDDILTWGGGLVEVKRNYPQFMHQTVLEFVTGYSFKNILLGDLATVVDENGHSFHLKYWISAWAYGYGSRLATNQMEAKERIAFHAVQSEDTTLRSHFDFFASIPTEQLQQLPAINHALKDAVNSLLAFSVSNGLVLCLRDWIESNPDVLRRLGMQPIHFPLLSSLVFMPAGGVFHEKFVVAASLLLENGFNITQDPGFFTTLIRRLCGLSTGGLCDIPKSALHKLAMLALEHGQDPNVIIDVLTGSKSISCSALHVVPPSLAIELVKHGADVNQRDSRGRTPLDWVLRHPVELSHSIEPRRDCLQRYEMCKILLSTENTVTLPSQMRYWAHALGEFDNAGYDTRGMREITAPRRTGMWTSWFGLSRY